MINHGISTGDRPFETGDTKRSSENELEDERRSGTVERGRAEDHRRGSKSPGMTFYARLLWERRIFCGPRCVGLFEIVTTDGRVSQSSSILGHTVLCRDYCNCVQQVSPQINLIVATLRYSACRSAFDRVMLIAKRYVERINITALRTEKIVRIQNSTR